VRTIKSFVYPTLGGSPIMQMLFFTWTKQALIRRIVTLHHKSTLFQAICIGHITIFPGLTAQLISKQLAPNIATALGHQDQEPQDFTPLKESDSRAKNPPC